MPYQPYTACGYNLKNKLGFLKTVFSTSQVENTLTLMFCFRGCSFVSKTKTVESHGAIAVFITDKLQYVNGEPLVDMIHDGTARDVHIPAGFMLGSDGYIYFCFYII